MKCITWLASYPKSGNTWLRVLFTNLLRAEGGPANINELVPVSLASDRELFDRLVGYEAADLTHDEIDRIRPDFYRYQASHAAEPFFCKVHDAYRLLPDGQPVFPLEVTAGAIYLVRNPLDVCVSLAHHNGERDFDKTIADMANPCRLLPGRRDRRLDPRLLTQRLHTWSDNVLSWVDAPGLRKHVLRYEDMAARPVETFAAAADFMGMTQDLATIRRVVEFSSFHELQRQERLHGFREAVTPQRSFFRKGKVGSWREVLTEAQVRRMIEDHREVMQRFGYLTEADEPVF
jgi:hypothetical protein